jgi:hypothetical protein
MHQEYIKYGSPAIKLLEEFSEVQKLICKGERFGYDDHHPEEPVVLTNRIKLISELDDVDNALANFRKWLSELPIGDVKRIEG